MSGNNSKKVHSMKEYLIKHLGVFPFIKKPLVVSSCEYETSYINEKMAEDILPGVFLRDEFRWLTPEGFHYYFPALIRNSLENLSATLCPIEQNWADFVEADAYRKIFKIDEKWNGFSLLQLRYLIRWNEWILKCEPYYLEEDYVVCANEKLKKLFLEKRN